MDLNQNLISSTVENHFLQLFFEVILYSFYVLFEAMVTCESYIMYLAYISA